jgi:hypothetical protein
LFEDESMPEGPRSADLTELREEAAQLQQTVYDKSAETTDAQAARGAGAGATTGTLKPVSFTPDPVSGGSPGDGVRMSIPDDVREQIRKQVRLSVAQHASGHLDSLADILHSGYAQIYLFQVAEPLDTHSELTGDRCGLASGDLLVMTTAFPRPGDEATLDMRVAASRRGHCASQDTVEVTVGELQEMLNAFHERVEVDMRKLRGCLGPQAACFRT